jgi:hypothetical protein
MKKIAMIAATGASLLAFAAPASATVTVGSNSYDVGQSFTIDFDGYGGETPAVINGLTSDITFTIAAISGSTYTLNYLIDNTSTSPITASRVSVFGFNTDPNYTSASVTGVFDTVSSGNVPNIGSVELCATDVNCAGGGSGGVWTNTAASDSDGVLTLNFASAGDITLDNFFVRYQSIDGAGAVTSAVGRPTDALPEPSTWAMMLFGFGAIGVAMRRSRRKTQLMSQLA